MVNPNRFYTYAYLREDRTPYYIGKGCGKRMYSKSKIVKPPKDKSRIIFLKQNLTEEEAFKHEKYMIAVFGRKDLGTGILHNKTDGGEGQSGAVRSEETRRKYSERQKGEKNNNYGKKGKENACYGLRWWNDGSGNQIRSKECPGDCWVLGMNEESKRKNSEANTGKNNPNYGKRGENSRFYGMKWWNNGCGNTKLSIECPGEGWILGRGKLTGKHKK